jgi:nucleoside 2-deoxyribosyltransferase
MKESKRKICVVFDSFDKERREIIAHMITLLKQRGHFVFSKHDFSSTQHFDEAMQDHSEVFARNVRRLDECDTIIIESTHAGFDSGFHLGFAHAKDKMIYVLYDLSLRESSPRMAVGHIKSFPYSSIVDINKFVEENF